MALIGVTGGQTWPPVTPAQKGSAVNRYDVVINGIQTTVQLSDEEAKARGLKTSDDKPAEKAKTPANKSRTPANKRAEAAKKSFGQSDKGDA